MEYYNYTDLDIASSKMPPNAHLLHEQGDVLIIVDDLGDDVYYSEDKGATWTSISAIVTHDTMVNAWHDQTNKFIYYQALTAGNTNAVYKLDASDADPSNWSITEIGANLNHYGLDIWIRDGNIEQLICDTIENDLEVWQWQDPNWVEIDDYAVQDTHIYGNKAVVIGTVTYFVYADALGDPSMFSFNGAAITKLDDQGVATREVPEEHRRQGMSYDGVDVIHFITSNLAQTTFYHTEYSIAGDTMTEINEFDICMQLDRNTASGVKEKAFIADGLKVYQLHGVITHQWHLIAKINATGKHIKAITDNFVMLEDD
jgi:hypothetical protein